jgi:hypothetical protein
MRDGVTSGGQRYQVLLGITAGVTAKLFVVNFQI